MKIENRAAKVFGLLHLADIIWLLLLAALVYAALRFSMPREANAQTGDVTIRYTIELGERIEEGNLRRVIPAGFHENVRVGEPVFDSLRGLRIGTIVAVSVLPYRVEAADEERGIIRQAVVEGLEFIHITVEARASISDYETLIGSFPVSVGREAFVRSKYFAGAGFIVAVDIIST